LGTDTGGSIRHPASFCGVVGLKPTYGACSRFGLIAMTSSTDVPGPIAKTSADAKIILKIIAGADEHDATSVDAKKIKKIKILEKNKPLAGVRVGLANQFFMESLDAQTAELVRAAVRELENLGAAVVAINLPHIKYAVSAYYLITPSEISSNLARFDGLRFGLKNPEEDLAKHYAQTRGEGFGPEVKRRIMMGTYALSAGYHDAYYVKAQTVRTQIINDFNSAFADVDVIAAPATNGPAFRLGEQNQEPLKMYLEDACLAPASLAGLPALSLPAGTAHNLPIGWQLIGPKFSDEYILSIAEIYEQATKFQKPELKI
jgi:aspartyl-tRNA(Asn)/glutamyl-tRNA(Gln) amidotransferase subunit A